MIAELTNALGLDWKMLIAQLVNFGILVVVLYFFAYKPLLKMLAKRSKKIEDSVKKAEEVDHLLTKTSQDYKAEMAQAQNEAAKIMDKAQVEAEKYKQENFAKARQEAEKIVAQSKATLTAEKAKIMGEIKDDVTNLVITATQKVLEREITAKDKEKKIKEVIAKLP